jgi:hypothetical protein
MDRSMRSRMRNARDKEAEFRCILDDAREHGSEELGEVRASEIILEHFIRGAAPSTPEGED